MGGVSELCKDPELLTGKNSSYEIFYVIVDPFLQFTMKSNHSSFIPLNSRMDNVLSGRCPSPGLPFQFGTIEAFSEVF